jgi:methionyl-tRNA formyltransferase
MDTGDIIAQKSFNLNQTQDVADALQILYPIYHSITSEVVRAINSGEAPRFKQNEVEATVFPRRTLEDGLIDWNQPASRVWNHVRAVAPPYPGAFAHWQGGKLWVYRISRTIPFLSGTKPTPGSLIDGDISQSKMVVACKDLSIEIDKFTFEGYVRHQ